MQRLFSKNLKTSKQFKYMEIIKLHLLMHKTNYNKEDY